MIAGMLYGDELKEFGLETEELTAALKILDAMKECWADDEEDLPINEDFNHCD